MRNGRRLVCGERNGARSRRRSELIAVFATSPKPSKASMTSRSGRLAFYGAEPTAKDPRLTVTGMVTDGCLHFRGVGVKGTAAEGWAYDYEGHLAPVWPNGVDQRPALIGWVIRAVPHPSGTSTAQPDRCFRLLVACGISSSRDTSYPCPMIHVRCWPRPVTGFGILYGTPYAPGCNGCAPRSNAALLSGRGRADRPGQPCRRLLACR